MAEKIEFEQVKAFVNKLEVIISYKTNIISAHNRQNMLRHHCS